MIKDNTRGLVTVVVVVLTFLTVAGLSDETKDDDTLLTVQRIFGGDEFKAKEYSVQWLEDGKAFTKLDSSQEYDGRHDIVRHDPATGMSEIMVPAAALIPPGE